jgi:hypothetical protein
MSTRLKRLQYKVLDGSCTFLRIPSNLGVQLMLLLAVKLSVQECRFLPIYLLSSRELTHIVSIEFNSW